MYAQLCKHPDITFIVDTLGLYQGSHVDISAYRHSLGGLF